MIISFAWTTPALLAGRKTVTRRQWSEKHASRFKEGTVVQAYDKSQRNGGKQVATLRVDSIIHERTKFMTEQDYEGEGFAYLYHERGVEETSPQAFEAWRKADMPMWVVRFSVIDSIPLDEWESQSSRQSRPMRLAGLA